MALDKNQIAQRIAQELEHNMYVNLGIGMPTLVANYIIEKKNITLQSENGMLCRRGTRIAFACGIGVNGRRCRRPSIVP